MFADNKVLNKPLNQVHLVESFKEDNISDKKKKLMKENNLSQYDLNIFEIKLNETIISSLKKNQKKANNNLVLLLFVSSGFTNSYSF